VDVATLASRPQAEDDLADPLEGTHMAIAPERTGIGIRRFFTLSLIHI
jgi:hypothetical protein